MKINICATWVPAGKPPHKGFKDPALCRALNAYIKKIIPYSRCVLTGIPPARKPGTKIWICDRARTETAWSSEDAAEALKREMNGGTKELFVLIGGADGFCKEDIERYQPERIWSFGPLTLPHELAAVVAAEQLYRALTILKGHPYHKSH